jgi:hypothetical protein
LLGGRPLLNMNVAVLKLANCLVFSMRLKENIINIAQSALPCT